MFNLSAVSNMFYVLFWGLRAQQQQMYLDNMALKLTFRLFVSLHARAYTFSDLLLSGHSKANVRMLGKVLPTL
jgi:hypothetical protein